MPTKKKAPPPTLIVQIKSNTCGDCRYYREDTEPGSEAKYCVRYPPVQVFDGQGVYPSFPGTGPENTCGEWMPTLNS